MGKVSLALQLKVNISENKCAKFEIKIPNGCWENSENL